MTGPRARSYAETVQRAIEAGDVVYLERLAFGSPCACLGRRDGEPVCPCRMIAAEVRRHIVPAALKRGRILPVKSS